MADTSEETYTCARCGREFEKEWTDEEAMAECAENFPAATAAKLPVDIICDECYQKFMGWWKGADPIRGNRGVPRYPDTGARY